MTTDFHEKDQKSQMPLGFFEYITPAMLLMLGAVAGICWWGWKSLLETFLHHPQLNSVILSLTIYGIFRIFSNSFNLYRTARFVIRIETLEKQTTPDETKVLQLIQDLQGAGSLLDLQNTELALRRMAKTGFFVITDNDSRLIKSKLGARIRFRFGHIGFFSGILISFGLLGTFVGLIQTVSSVGEQMGVVANALSQGQNLNVIDLITGISKPLEGMGTAFGASLFGLGGSMILSGMNHLGSHAQDEFIESFSRWLDAHIPNAKHEVTEKARQLIAPQTTEKETRPQPAPIASPAAGGSQQAALSMEIATFMVLAEETHKQLRSLATFMGEMSQAITTQHTDVKTTQALMQQQNEYLKLLQTQLAALPGTGTQMINAMSGWQKAVGPLQQIPDIGGKVVTAFNALQSSHRGLAGRAEEQTKHLAHIAEQVDQLRLQTEKAVETLKTSSGATGKGSLLGILNPFK